MRKISYSAPGKIIISGEHAVVYGKPGLISALGLRLKFTVWESKKETKDEIIKMIYEKVKDYLKSKKLKFNNSSFDYQIESQIPQGKNLGSSAAFSVASSAALLEFYTGKQFDKSEINVIAYEIEKYFHGKPSGGDNSTSCFGGLVYFRKEFEFLKNISALNIRIPKKIDDALYIIDSGKPKETTKEMIEMVGKLLNKYPKKIEGVFNKIEKITKRIVLSIVQENVQMFKQSIIENQRLFENLKVVSQKTKRLLSELKKFGVGKVTGAGGFKEGSGNLLFFADKPKELEFYLKKNKINFLKFKQDFEGVRKES